MWHSQQTTGRLCLVLGINQSNCGTLLECASTLFRCFSMHVCMHVHLHAWNWHNTLVFYFPHINMPPSLAPFFLSFLSLSLSSSLPLTLSHFFPASFWLPSPSSPSSSLLTHRSSLSQPLKMVEFLAFVDKSKSENEAVSH